MSRYLDGEEVTCADIDCAACDRCGEGLVDWRNWQSREAEEQQQVQRLLDELADSCPVCWILDGEDDSYLHSLVGCQRFRGLGQVTCDEFRIKIRYERGSHTCMKCGISQKLCATGEDRKARCQWSNVLVPVVKVAVETVGGLEIVRKAGFEEELGGDLSNYGKWLGQRHVRRVWGLLMSNAMVVLIKVVLYIDDRRQGREVVQLQEERIQQKEA